MFQFPGFALRTYGFSTELFGNLGINTRLTIPPSLSQSSTPFIASWRLDIPHTPLLAWHQKAKGRGRLRKVRGSCQTSFDPGIPVLTQGTETSQYLEEEKENSIPSVAASERGTAQTPGVTSEGSRTTFRIHNS